MTGNGAHEAQGAYGERMGAYFRLPNAPYLSTSCFKRTRLAVTHLRQDQVHHGLTSSIPRENSYLITFKRRELSFHTFFLGEKCRQNVHFPEGSLCFVNLEEEPRADMQVRFDLVQFYVPHRALQECASMRPFQTSMIFGAHHQVPSTPR